jgi:transcriptional regulator with XRE-family HTH domain
MSSVGERIKFLRTLHGYTLKELAQLSGVHRGNIIRYEKDRRSPTVETLQKLCNVFGISLSEFFEDDSKRFSLDVLQIVDYLEDLSPETRRHLIQFLRDIIPQKEKSTE